MTLQISLEELIQSGAHFGHQSRRWNPKMSQYIYGVKDGIHIFDLIKTKEKLAEALEAIRQYSKEGKTIVFVGTKKQAKEKVKKVALSTNSFYVNERWLGGTLTNFDQIKKSVYKLSDLKAKKEKGDFKSFTKKERLLIDREIENLERFFGGIANISRTPDLLVVIDTKKEHGAIKEANFLGIPTVGVVDSNSDPDEVDYPIPMNDDASKAIEYVLGLMEESVLLGKGIKKDVGNLSAQAGKMSDVRERKSETKKLKNTKPQKSKK